MKLSDVMSAADLAVYAEIGLVLFLLAFMGVLVKVMLSKKENYEAVASLVLDEEGQKVRARIGEKQS